MKYAELISSDNVLRFSQKNDDVEEFTMVETSTSPEVALSRPALPPSSTVEIINSDYIEIPIPLKNGKAYLRVPESATEEDYQKIARIVEAYK